MKMKKALLAGVAALFLATGTAHAAETLTLACEGTIGPIDHRESREPVSMSIIVNFASKTVHGFDVNSLWFGGSKGEPAKIIDATETVAYFEGKGKSFGYTTRIMGTIDRVTGDVEVSSTTWNGDQPVGGGEGTMYELKCKPAQRMF